MKRKYVRLFVCLFDETCLELTIFMFHFQDSLWSVSGSQSQTEPKILRLVQFNGNESREYDITITT